MKQGSQQHYDSHLASFYTWMAGRTAAAMDRNRKFLEAHIGRAKAPAEPPQSRRATEMNLGGSQRALPPRLDEPQVADKAAWQEPSPYQPLAVDLGCGPGVQSVPLAELGYRVVAIDNCCLLLAELVIAQGSLPIRLIEADLTRVRSCIDESPSLIVCLGDTLTHLPSLEAVASLIRDIGAALKPGGRCLLGFRDYVSRELVGEQRFIPVRSDESRILTCFLEYHPDHVLVHDLLHERSDTGWTQRVSAYRKLRLDPAWVVDSLSDAGLIVVEPFVESGMVCLAAGKPALS